MALKRIWTPTGNYSNGGKKDILVIHTMEGFTGNNGAYDCAKYFQGDVGASSQVCIDNNRGTIWECVTRQYGSWTQCAYNSRAISCEQSGYASWSKDYWLKYRRNQLENIAEWLAEESAKTGIPLINIASISAAPGVIYHSELGYDGCGHSDPGYGWPIEEVLAWANGGIAEPPPQRENDVTAATALYNGKKWRACIGTDNRIYYQEPGSSQWTMVDVNSNARSGLSYVIDNEGARTITYTNHVGTVCEYTLPASPESGTKWAWNSLGGNAR